jgi:hypothetical protein
MFITLPWFETGEPLESARVTQERHSGGLHRPGQTQPIRATRAMQAGAAPAAGSVMTRSEGRVPAICLRMAKCQPYVDRPRGTR